MNSKLLMTTLVGLATVGGLFLFSSDSKPESQSAGIVETAITPLPSPTPKSLQGSPVIGSVPEIAPTPTPLPTATPVLTPAPTTTPTPAPTSTPSQTPEQSGKININTADKQGLEEITGVGPTIAQRIIDYRQTNGPFQKIEDLKNVKGIGDKTFEKMKDEITI